MSRDGLRSLFRSRVSSQSYAFLLNRCVQPLVTHLVGLHYILESLSNTDKHRPLPRSVNWGAPANQSPLSLPVPMEPGQASPVCLVQDARTTAVFVVSLVQQPGLKDARPQKKTSRRPAWG